VKSALTKNKGSHQVRIIGGQWKRTPLPVPDGEGLRPTPDRVRETVFNWIHHLMDGEWRDMHCLDLFAGTGVLGFEAASRGAAKVVMVEMHTPALRQLEISRGKLNAEQVSLLRGDAIAFVQAAQRNDGAKFDLIFLDPPYQQDWLAKILPLCAPLLASDGLIYVEAEFSLTSDPAPEWLQNWEVLRADKAGAVFYHLLRANKSIQLQA
tara:strand:- start:945196 stop:945822 length:627 start_codon:yes stop_codon:yes gene_type:complete